MPEMLSDPALDQLFREARTPTTFNLQPVSDVTLQELYGLVKWGPTSANSSPARFVFIRTPDGQERLKPALSPGNVAKMISAPVTAIVAYDPDFFDYLPMLFQAADAKAWFADNPALAEATAQRNGTLQGAYLILAARALGLDAAPMSGFDNAMVDREFFSGTGFKSNFLVALGHADTTVALPERDTRLRFDEAVTLA